MENQQTSLDKAVKVSIILATLIFSLSVAYYFVIFLPQKEKLAIEQQKQTQEAKDRKEEQAKDEAKQATDDAKTALQDCLSQAYDEYSSDWDSQCKSTGLKANCSLDDTTLVEKRYKDSKDECFKQYPQK